MQQLTRLFVLAGREKGLDSPLYILESYQNRSVEAHMTHVYTCRRVVTLSLHLQLCRLGAVREANRTIVVAHPSTWDRVQLPGTHVTDTKQHTRWNGHRSPPTSAVGSSSSPAR